MALGALAFTQCYWFTPYEDLTSAGPVDAGAADAHEVPDAPAAKDAPAADIPYPPGGPWTLVFQDEFEGKALDGSKWDTQYPRGGDDAVSNTGNGEAQGYQAANVTVLDGWLNLTAKRESVRLPSGKMLNFSSGMVQSTRTFRFSHGYMEARLSLPKGSGLWASFWTWPASESWPPEIDVASFYGDNVARVYYAFHPTGADALGGYYEDADFTATPHVFAADWEADRIEFSVDGKPARTVQRSTDTELYLILTLAVPDGTGAPAPNGSTVFPSAFKADYVRVFAHR
jgi:beta-glucanase (GH16 family)